MTDKLLILITMIVCMGCSENCSIQRSMTECYEEVACPGNPEDEGYYCPEGHESYSKPICNSEECTLYKEEMKGPYFQDDCPQFKDPPENCYLECLCML